MGLRYGPDTQPMSAVLTDFAHKRQAGDLTISSLMPLSADRFLAIVEEERRPPAALLLDAMRSAGGHWVARGA